jgi:hypothetical protein
VDFVKQPVSFFAVIPAKAGIQNLENSWIPGRGSFSLRLIRPLAESPPCPE